MAAHDHAHHDGHDHGSADPHDHAHDHRDTPARKLAIILAMTLAFCAVEALAGWAFRSLALLADAGHMLSDSAALLLAWIAQRIATRDRTRHRTFGYRRAEVLAAFVNGIALGVAAIGIAIEAVRRWDSPPTMEARGVLITATLGLLVNVVAALILARGAHHNANTRAALAHVAADAVGSVGAIAAALAVIFFGWKRADPLISAGIALLLAYGAWRLVARTTSVLMEGTPPRVDLQALERVVVETPGVREAHDLHAWTISDGFDAVSVHVVLADGFHGVDVADAVSRRVHDTFGVEHVTVQPERKPPSLVPAAMLTRPRQPGLGE
ncbi:MAG: cation diffusion facilitator family transporter [Polyangiales bacterium]